MKSFVILSVLIAVVSAVPSPQNMNPEMQKIVDTCLKENAVNEQEFHDYFAGKLSPALVKDNLKCGMQCFMVKSGFMDEAGKFNVEAAKVKLSEGGEEKKKMADALDKCHSATGPTPCETAYMIVNCMMENKVKMQE